MAPSELTSNSMTNSVQFDVVVIGSGAAGLGLALSLADHAKVAIISKSALRAGSSPYAQGGIAAVVDRDDDIEPHIQDTMNAGAGLCDEKAVRFTVENAKQAIYWLIDHNVKFTMQDAKGIYHLTKEGGHSRRRIYHAADRTGAVVIDTLGEQVIRQPNIACFIEHTAIDLIVENNRCVGITAFDNQHKLCKNLYAKAIVLATGGASSVYLHTSNPDFTSGDGIGMAYRAGCRIANLEFNQFHPTCLYHPNAHSFLISEMLRGEGAQLLLPDGTHFMPNYDSRAELAPRDIVARAIDSEMKKHKAPYVLLDISFKPQAEIRKLFPTIYERCLEYGIDITKQPIPVVPAAHYTCGGIVTDLNGKTDMQNLYAIGETACTGLHGANRMASNSLLECLVFAMSAAKSIKDEVLTTTPLGHDEPIFQPGNKMPRFDIQSLTHQVRQIMWDNVGIVRNNQRLLIAQQSLQSVQQKVQAHFTITRLSKPLIELRNLVDTALLIVQCCLARKESRGLHFSEDYSETLSSAKDSVISSQSIKL